VTSGRIFEYVQGQTSEPIETETGWYIVRCGKVVTGEQTPFAEVQDDIRTELEDRRFNEEATKFIRELATTAAISPMEPFVNVALERAVALAAMSDDSERASLE
jgi:parvulin-like peptidyl-prolyl isomerase